MGESLGATASTVRTWILLEQPGPWGRDALSGSRLPPGVGRRLRRMGRDLDVRIVLIRRYGGTSSLDGIRCFVAHTAAAPGRSWIERATLATAADLFDADLSSLRHGAPPGLGPRHLGPVYLVCTHGRRDPCCAERGRPVARALDRAFGEEAWETSHIGGDRFAANLVCFPHGAYFGRVDPPAAVRVAQGYGRGRLAMEWYRGRSCHPFPVQAAEIEVRTRGGLDGVDDVGPARWTVAGPSVIDASFDTAAGSTATVRVRTVAADGPRLLTCHAEAPVRPPAYRIESFAEVRSRPVL